MGKNQDQPPKESEPLSNRGGGGGRPSGLVWDGQRGSRFGGHPDNVNKSDTNKVTCFNCQKLGHYWSECPEGRAKFSRIHSPDPTLPEVKPVGRINEVDCPAILDTGATRSAIPGRLIRESQLTGGRVKVTLADLSVTHLREARVEITVERKVATVRAMVLKDNAPDILLGTDHPLTRSLLEGRRPKVDDPIPCHVRAITRAQSQAQEKEQVDNLAAGARDGAMPRGVKLAAPPIGKPVRQDKGQTPKEPAFNVSPCEGSPPVVVGPVEAASSEADPNTSPQVEEWAEVVGGECLTERSDIEEIDEVGMEKENPWAEMVEADNLLGLEREDIEASDQPLPNLAEGKEEARVLASRRKMVVWLR